MFRMEEKPAPFTKAVKSAAPAFAEATLGSPNCTRKFDPSPNLAHPPLKKAQTIEGPVGASPACCHSERSEESLCGFAYSKDRDREILRSAQNDTQGGGRHSAGEAGFNRL
jgi:hypothetical protein